LPNLTGACAAPHIGSVRGRGSRSTPGADCEIHKGSWLTETSLAIRRAVDCRTEARTPITHTEISKPTLQGRVHQLITRDRAQTQLTLRAKTWLAPTERGRERAHCPIAYSHIHPIPRWAGVHSVKHGDVRNTGTAGLTSKANTLTVLRGSLCCFPVA
jgi:hypothetical protein